MRRSLEQFLLKRWYSDKPIRLLQPLAWLYKKVSEAKRQSYHSGKKEVYQAPVPVIVVGNITVGGTGKTPVVIFLVNELRKIGYSPAVISRGYGADLKTSCLLTQSSNYQTVGDEPMLIKQRAAVPVAVGRDRKASIELILNEYPEVDVIISDDGLQHYALQREIEVVVVDAERGLGNKSLLPAGPLRESIARLLEVDVVLLNGEFASDINGIAFNLKASELINLRTDEHRSLSEFSQVEAYAGIGNPERFFRLLRSAGLQVNSHFVGDHGAKSERFFSVYRDKTILMTEKDAVKLDHVSHDNLWYLPVNVQMADNDKLRLLDIILTKIKA